jgi:hypothetical protein
MLLILVLTIDQAVSSTLAWIGFYTGIRAVPGGRARQSRWIIGSAVVAAAWLIGVFLLSAAGAFRNDALPPRIPMALAATLLPGYLLLLSPTFRRIVAAVPQHWLIGIQTFRILGSALLVRYFAGQLPVFSRCRPESATSRPDCSRFSLPMPGIAASPMLAALRSR